MKGKTMKKITQRLITTCLCLLAVIANADSISVTPYISNQSWNTKRIEVEKEGTWFSSKSTISLPAGSQTQLSEAYPYFKGDYFKEFMRMKVYDSISYPYYIDDEVFVTAAYNEYGELSHILCTSVFQKVTCDPLFIDTNNANIVLTIY